MKLKEVTEKIARFQPLGTAVALILAASLLLPNPQLLAEDRLPVKEQQQPATVVPGRPFSFPADHGSHHRYGTEWWYFTGQLRAIDDPGRSFGFQLTFFRRNNSGDPAEESQQYLAHAALSDLTHKRFTFDHRRARGGLLRMGFAAQDKLDVAVGRWRAYTVAESLVLDYETSHQEQEIAVSLIGPFTDRPLLHGEGGFSRKGNCPECASYYYSLPRIPMQGEVRQGPQRHRVQGLVWMDHEFMSNALRPTVQGWDWFSLHTDGGGALMLFRVRHSDGEGAFLSGTWQSPEGQTIHLDGSQFRIEERRFWQSPHSNGRYPIEWFIAVPAAGIETVVQARFPEQEIHITTGADNSAPTYWEGAIASPDQKFQGYLEMTGYDKPLGALF
ncbi:MAG: lipocalin-like domain-containing protein [Bdellovibrionota bacterium]|nr:MAG: lipocalin-like domain-containing protein [Bdellovibrionota bacterium]